jgi:hypothetical protein
VGIQTAVLGVIVVVVFMAVRDNASGEGSRAKGRANSRRRMEVSGRELWMLRYNSFSLSMARLPWRLGPRVGAWPLIS